MTKTFKSALMAGALILGGAMASCTNEGPDVKDNGNDLGNLLIKSPEMIAYTGDQTLGEYGTKAEAGEKTWEYVSRNDVEINLALNAPITEKGVTKDGVEYDKDYISSHLSIHIRTPRNVEVTIPVSKTLVCDADDMEIVKSHKLDALVYGDLNHTLEMEIDGNTVKVTVAYNENNFTITTEGVNQAVIDYLAAEHEDGITFEIWNYYNTEMSREDLKEILNGATVKFLDDDAAVDYYVNAFYKERVVDANDVETGRIPNEWDCEVNICGEQENDFVEINYNDATEFHGYNNSGINKVWKNKNLIPAAE